ncbi:LuxR C-terminal-related transcriptional regulator [Phascolarctobacterium sp.]|uniref:LuxR C-terminal-related transcriptional regulator n=1 Tax=Phascolarctobacterium sp. TaxID=2049039 RepID=UPI003867979B
MSKLEARVYSLIKQLPNIIKQLPEMNRTLRGRLAVYFVLLLCCFATGAILLLSLLGVLNPEDKNVQTAMDYELKSAAVKVNEEVDKTAAIGIGLSREISEIVERKLLARQIEFKDLNNNPEALEDIQAAVFGSLRRNLHMSSSSGAFYMLNATVNSHVPDKTKHALYLKYINVYADSKYNDTLTFIRGIPSLARKHQIAMYTSWQLEMLPSLLPQYNHVMNNYVEDLSNAWLMTQSGPIRDTWERAHYILVPIHLQGTNIGVVGFEMNDLVFQMKYAIHNPNYPQLSCNLFDSNEQDSFSGRITGIASEYTPDRTDNTIDGYSYLSSNEDSTAPPYIGKQMVMNFGRSRHLLTVVMPESAYNSIINTGRLKLIAMVIIILIAFALACLWFSHRYVVPIVDTIEHLKDKHLDGSLDSNIVEINDFLDYLSDKDKEQEQKLYALHQQKNRLEIEYTALTEELERQKLEAEHNYARIHMELEDQKQQAFAQYQQAKAQLDSLLAKQQPKIDNSTYSLFVEQLKNLTNKERQIFDMYIEGKTGKDIQEILEITDNTLKYHNKNIYSKLGVKSRKELLVYAKELQKGSAPHKKINF